VLGFTPTLGQSGVATCNIVDWDIFVDMYLLKSPIIIGEKFIGIFFSIVSKIQVK
jgi:hypothetical protein